MSIQKSYKFAVFALLTFMLFFYLLFSGFRVFIDPQKNGLLALLSFILLVLSEYYLYYRYVQPDMQQRSVHGFFQLVAACGLISAGLGVWLYTDIETFRNLINPQVIFLSSTLFPSLIINNMNTIRAVLVTGLLSITFFTLSITFRLLLKKKAFLIISKKIMGIFFLFFILSMTTYVFSSDLFTIIPGYKSVIFKSGGSEQYVYNRIENSELSFIEDLNLAGGFNYITWGENKEKSTPYLSQTGFYGAIPKLAQTLTRAYPNRVIYFTRLILSFLTALIFTLLVYHILYRFGFPAAILFWLPVLFTFWIIAPTNNLIWFYFLLYLPFSCSLLLYSRVINDHLTYKRFLLFIFIILIFVFLRGYTYASNLILSAAIPVFFYELNARKNFFRIITRCIQTSLVGTAAFILVLFIHGIQLSLFLGGVDAAVAFLTERIILRTAGVTGVTYLELIRKWLEVRFFYFGDLDQMSTSVSIFLEEINKLKYFHLFSLILVATVILPFLFSMSKKRVINKQTTNFTLVSLALTLIVACFSSWTWIAAKGHMEVHINMNGIIYMIPFAVVSYIYFGVLGQHLVNCLGTFLAGKEGP